VREVKIASLVTEDGQWLPVQKRTAALIVQVYQYQDEIEAFDQGTMEILVDVKGGAVRSRFNRYRVGETDRIE
jgi:hypothetical protein